MGRGRACLAAMLAFAISPAAHAGDACDTARATLRSFITSLPVEATLCDKTEDCKPYYIYAQSCDPPVILGLAGDRYVGYSTPTLIPLQRHVRAVCPEPKIACEPRLPAFSCIDHVCKVTE